MAAAISLLTAMPNVVTADGALDRGAYLIAAGGCVGCHTLKNGDDRDFLAGGRAIETDFGTFYAPNITPDRETGIGNWTDADFILAFRQGVNPQGQHLFPVFPYPSYTGITDEDLLAMKLYLFSIDSVKRERKPHKLKWYLGWRPILVVWKWLGFSPGSYRVDEGQSEKWNRGGYLVRHLGHCGECHTPRNIIGGKEISEALTGNLQGPENEQVPGITPLEKDGIASWSDSDLEYFLEIGMYPDGDFVGGSMTEVVDHNTSKLTPADRQAIVAYLRSL